MALDLTFKQICDLIKKDENADPALIEAVDKLLGLTIICAPAFLGPAAAAFLPLLAVKNELVRLGKSVVSKITGESDRDYLGREQRMQTAYGVICYTAFFDALDASIPRTLRKKIGLLESGKAFLVDKARAERVGEKDQSGEDAITLAAVNPVTSIPLPFPHPIERVEEQLQRHAELWKQMSQGFGGFVQKLAFWDKATEKERAQLMHPLKELPETAAKCFQAQYFELARRFEDFALWANLQEHKETKKLLSSLSAYVQQHAALVTTAQSDIDIGLAKMHTAVLSMPEILKTSQAVEIFNSLKRHSEERINEPIAEQGGGVQMERGQSLRFPRIVDAFIPQSYQVLRADARARSLEDPQTWEDLRRGEDLGAFLLAFLNSPYSTRTPIVALGHPGSGKSLLTKVLSAQLMSKHFTVVRVPLREVNAEAGVVAQIEERIRGITHVSDPWAKLSGAFKNNPPLVILDGYDELLQASGKVFRSYLNDVVNFQRGEFEQGRPVRVMVTSRITLIDKAIVPEGTTIIRLLEFNEQQRQCWINIWNRENAGYFAKAGIEPFMLPEDRRNGGAKILALAEQPLLLLMLALYDSEGNALRKSKSLDRTILYDSLLRRFVAREMAKDKAFFELSSKEQDAALDGEMQRLAVAALGMYNRRKLHILSSELNADIKFFSLERPTAVADGRELSQAELLLGRFFFVHKSEAQVKAGLPAHHEGEAAFEFLHNTFGEFLTADFMLRQAVKEAAALRALQESEDLRAQLQQRLGAADGFDRAWFASLVYTPLFTRPVVLEMIREWVAHTLKKKGMQKKEFLAYLDTLVLNQLKRLLEKREMPSIIRKETAQEGFRAPFGDHPLLGHIAIYSLNLVLLRAIVGDEPFVFDEGRIGLHEDGARPWDRLAHIWRSWFALDNLNGVTAVLDAKRHESMIHVKAKERFQLADSQSRLETYLNVSISLADDIGTGLTGLLCHETLGDAQVGLSDIGARLRAERIDLDFPIASTRLWRAARDVDGGDVNAFQESAREALSLALKQGTTHELVCIAVSIRAGIRRLWQRRIHGPSMDVIRVFRDAIEAGVAAEVGLREPMAGILLYRLAEELHDYEWMREFRHLCFDSSPRRWHLRRMAERGPEGLFSLIELAKELGGAYFFRRVDPGFFEGMFEPRFLFELSERNPEVALTWIQLAMEVGATRFHGQLDPESIQRAFHPRRMLELSERNPEAVLTWLRLAKEVGGEQFVRQLQPEFFERAFHPRRLLELSERNPEAVFSWLRLAKEIGAERVLGRLGPELIERAFQPRHLLELAERDPEAALTWVQLAEEVGATRFRGQLDPELFERVFHPRRLLELSERNPEAVLAWLELAKEVDVERFVRQLDRELIERVFHPCRLLELSERNPKGALALIQAAREIDVGRFLRIETRQEMLDAILSRSDVATLLHLSPAVLATVLWFVHLSGSENMAREVHRAFPGGPDGSSRLSAVAQSLPISSLPDLQWFIHEVGAVELAERLREWTGAS